MGMGAALSGAIPSFYSNPEDIALRRSQKIDQALEREAQEGYQAPSYDVFSSTSRVYEPREVNKGFGDEDAWRAEKLCKLFGYKKEI